MDESKYQEDFASSDLSDPPSDLDEYLSTQTAYNKEKRNNLHHSETQNFCFLCNLSLKNRCELDSHMHFHKPSLAFKCAICGRSFKLKRALTRHSREVHADEAVQRFSKRKTSKWLKTYHKTSEAEEKLFQGELEKANMVYFQELSQFSETRSCLENEWIFKDFSTSLLYEEYFIESSQL